MSSSEDLDFEISFYEKILQGNPDFIQALIALGETYTKKGRYKDGLRVDRHLAQLRPQDSTVHYNLACSYSLLKMSDSCLKSLTKALRLGYCDFAFMQGDQDLAFIREDPRYQQLISSHV